LKRTNERITALRKTFADHKPDVIISFLTKTNIMTLEAAKSLKAPVIISERNNPNAQQFNRMWRTARAHTYPRAFAFVTMTRGAAEYYPERQRPRTTIIPNPINLPEDWRNQRGGKILTAVGRLTEQKRFDVLIDAFAEIADDFSDWTLTIWGEGEDRAKLEAQRDALGLSERIKMPGLTPKPGAWIETADVFALSSDYEGWANVILEAMAAGLPIVSTDCPYSPGDLLDHGRSGMLVSTGDAHAFAGALSEVLADQSLRDHLGDNAREASRQYRTEKIVAQWDALVNAAYAEQRKR
ncbi:MAG: glycosyltransferase family 4 protein, partial [Pseudomonadota bacterium]